MVRIASISHNLRQLLASGPITTWSPDYNRQMKKLKLWLYHSSWCWRTLISWQGRYICWLYIVACLMKSNPHFQICYWNHHWSLLLFVQVQHNNFRNSHQVYRTTWLRIWKLTRFLNFVGLTVVSHPAQSIRCTGLGVSSWQLQGTLVNRSKVTGAPKYVWCSLV